MSTSGRSARPRTRSKRQRAGRKKAKRGAIPIALVVKTASWRAQKPALALVRRAARLALALGAGNSGRAKGKLTILLAGDEHLAKLNARFRERKGPTNVLAFPAPAKGDYLGDVAIAYGVTRREAREQKKPFAAHAAHLAAHGVLHLLGHDHARARKAAIMEALETRILARLGLPDPYAARSAAA